MGDSYKPQSLRRQLFKDFPILSDQVAKLFEAVIVALSLIHISARLTRPSEPILFPKVRIYFADFPYLHCSKTKGYTPWRPAADMGTV